MVLSVTVITVWGTQTLSPNAVRLEPIKSQRLILSQHQSISKSTHSRRKSSIKPVRSFQTIKGSILSIQNKLEKLQKSPLLRLRGPGPVAFPQEHLASSCPKALTVPPPPGERKFLSSCGPFTDLYRQLHRHSTGSGNDRPCTPRRPRCASQDAQS